MTDAGARHDMLIRSLVAEAATRDVMAMKEPDAIERSGHEHVARLLREAIAVLTEPLREAITALSEGEAPRGAPDNEGLLLRRFSDLLTGGNAGTWGDIEDAIQRLAQGEPAQTYAWVEGLRASLRAAHGRANAAEALLQTALEGRAAPPVDGLRVIPGAKDAALGRVAPEPETGWQPIRALAKTWKTRARTMSANAKDTVVESLIAQRADAFRECADELAAAVPREGRP